ncbi:MAG: 5-formyltetrahydrofolate cyclo-ligase [Clostridia bacterium]|nr:5-formyltetrahydrofolate cyclo-ligase [Clostridia bacterium]
MNKKALRKDMSAKKAAMTKTQIERASLRLANRLFETQAYQNAQSVYCYVSFNQEVDTSPILRRAWRDGKRVAVPKCYGKEMRFIWIENMNELAPGFYGIPEPVADAPVAQDERALIIMPGLAFDREGHRVGYGGGYYDRYLEQQPNHPTVALCFDFQMLERLNVDAYDIPVDFVIVDQGEAEAST